MSEWERKCARLWFHPLNVVWRFRQYKLIQNHLGKTIRTVFLHKFLFESLGPPPHNRLCMHCARARTLSTLFNFLMNFIWSYQNFWIEFEIYSRSSNANCVCGGCFLWFILFWLSIKNKISNVFLDFSFFFRHLKKQNYKLLLMVVCLSIILFFVVDKNFILTSHRHFNGERLN